MTEFLRKNNSGINVALFFGKPINQIAGKLK